MAERSWELTASERRTLERVLDALLPPEGSFPAPSTSDVIDGFIMRRVVAEGVGPVPYPGIDSAGLKGILAMLGEGPDVVESLQRFDAERPADFLALWQLVVYGYYSRPEVIHAIQTDLACEYHGAPLPLGYAHVLTSWDASHPLEMPRQPVGSYIETDQVRRVDLSGLETHE
jgi:hypothetical protein